MHKTNKVTDRHRHKTDTDTDTDADTDTGTSTPYTHVRECIDTYINWAHQDRQ